MVISERNINSDFEKISVSKFWSGKVKGELKMHKIHAYPAKFSPSLVQKSIEYLRKHSDGWPEIIGDIFCGCGTTALETKKNGIDFWGCDINPVATLITKVKSDNYKIQLVKSYFTKIISNYHSNENFANNNAILENERIMYWYFQNEANNLIKLLNAIQTSTPRGKYRDYFLCAFSNILKACSRWLTKSIKPQVDPIKAPSDVLTTFKTQIEYMLTSTQEIELGRFHHKIREIETINILSKRKKNFLNAIVTSPPYVTSYEYADLHQLSSMWLGYTDDYRTLREGTVGSLYHERLSATKIKNLNPIGKSIYDDLSKFDKGKALSVAKYLSDMEKIIGKSYDLLTDNGKVIYVIGNTSYSGVEVNNARYFCSCMIESGFRNIEIFKRELGPKNLTPYRDLKGKFSNNKSDRKVYSHEFVIVGNK